MYTQIPKRNQLKTICVYISKSWDDFSIGFLVLLKDYNNNDDFCNCTIRHSRFLGVIHLIMQNNCIILGYYFVVIVSAATFIKPLITIDMLMICCNKTLTNQL